MAYLVSFAASIPQLALFANLIADPAGFLRGPGGDTAHSGFPACGNRDGSTCYA